MRCTYQVRKYIIFILQNMDAINLRLQCMTLLGVVKSKCWVLSAYCWIMSAEFKAPKKNFFSSSKRTAHTSTRSGYTSLNVNTSNYCSFSCYLLGLFMGVTLNLINIHFYCERKEKFISELLEFGFSSHFLALRCTPFYNKVFFGPRIFSYLCSMKRNPHIE